MLPPCLTMFETLGLATAKGEERRVSQGGRYRKRCRWDCREG